MQVTKMCDLIKELSEVINKHKNLIHFQKLQALNLIIDEINEEYYKSPPHSFEPAQTPKAENCENTPPSMRL